MSDPAVSVAVLHTDPETRERFASWLAQRDVYEFRPVGVESAADTDWSDVDVLLLDWSLTPDERTALVEWVGADDSSTAVLAVFEGVPETDPIANGADHVLQLPTAEETFLTELRIVLLQQRYDQDFVDLVGAIARSETGSGDEVDRVIARADDTLDELSDHLSYVDIFRRLIDE